MPKACTKLFFVIDGLLYIRIVQIILNAFDTDKIYGVIHASNSDVIFMHIEHNLYMQYYSENHAWHSADSIW